MTIAFQAPASEFADALFAALQDRLSGDQLSDDRLSGETLLRWEPGTAAPDGVTVLLVIGAVTRELMASLPGLQLVQTVIPYQPW